MSDISTAKKVSVIINLLTACNNTTQDKGGVFSWWCCHQLMTDPHFVQFFMPVRMIYVSLLSDFVISSLFLNPSTNCIADLISTKILIRKYAKNLKLSA